MVVLHLTGSAAIPPGSDIGGHPSLLITRPDSSGRLASAKFELRNTYGDGKPSH